MYRADGAEWIHTVVREHAKHAVICLDAFHVVAWAMKALDKVRTRTLTAAGTRDRHLMWDVRNNPADLTSEQTTTLAAIQTTNTHLCALTKRAYGFHSPEALIGMAMLTRGGLCPPLPGRAA